MSLERAVAIVAVLITVAFLMLLGLVLWVGYSQSTALVQSQRAGCERGKLDRKVNAAGWRSAEKARRASGTPTDLVAATSTPRSPSASRRERRSTATSSSLRRSSSASANRSPFRTWRCHMPKFRPLKRIVRLWRSAITGRFVSREYAEAHPDVTVSETRPVEPKDPAGA